MDIEHFVSVMMNKPVAQNSHKTREYNQVGFVFVYFRYQGLIIRHPVFIGILVDNHGIDICLAGTLQAHRVSAITDNGGNRRIDPALACRVDDCLQVGTAA
jgi:hypothetical protein